MIRMIIAALLALVPLAGCLPTLTSQSPAPPSRVARLEPIDGFWQVKNYKLEITQGVAIALTCSSSGPCRGMKLSSQNPDVVDVRAASFAKLEDSDFGKAQATPASLVVVGKSPGEARVQVVTEDGDRTIFVTVLPPPVPTTADRAASTTSQD